MKCFEQQFSSRTKPANPIHPARAAAGSYAFHEVWPAIVEQVFEVVESISAKPGDGRCVLVEAVEDAEAAVLGFHLFGQFLGSSSPIWRAG